jgi:hypothetical protein
LSGAERIHSLATIGADNPFAREGMRAPAPRNAGLLTGIGGHSMSLHLQIVHDPSGTWSLHGLPGKPVTRLATLAASIDYARRQCAAKPATIELIVDGSYAVIHQEHGWPRQPVATDPTPDSAPVDPEDQALPSQRGTRGWFQKWGKSG